jgi:hypothetical protein
MTTTANLYNLQTMRGLIRRFRHLMIFLIGIVVCLALSGALRSSQAQQGTIPLPGTPRDTTLIQTVESSKPGFGQQVELDGEWLMTSTYANEILIYRRNSSGQYKTHSTIQVEEYDGYLTNAPAFGLENNRVFIAGKDPNDYEPGIVLVYEPNSSDVWTLVTTIHPTEPPEVYENWFGSWISVDKSGEQFLSAGLVYRRTPDGTWYPAGRAPGAFSDATISGNTYITAFMGDKDLYVQNVRFYTHQGDDQYWDNTGSLYMGSVFGIETIIEGSTAAASGYDDVSGFVYMMQNDGSGWEFGQQIRPSDVSGSDSETFGVGIAKDGDQMVVSRLSNEPNQNVLYFYSNNGQSWVKVGMIGLPGIGYRFFGYGSLDLENGVTAVSDIGYSFDAMGNETYAPKIYLYEVASGQIPTPVPTEDITS